ncbi:MAG: hypothetical protein ACR2P2_08400 [Nakamurella sp.]
MIAILILAWKPELLDWVNKVPTGSSAVASHSTSAPASSTKPSASTSGNAPTSQAITTTGPGKGTQTGNAMKTLDTLTVKGKAPMTGYDRVGEFGQAWTDDNSNPLGHNGCDTRIICTPIAASRRLNSL